MFLAADRANGRGESGDGAEGLQIGDRAKACWRNTVTETLWATTDRPKDPGGNVGITTVRRGPPVALEVPKPCKEVLAHTVVYFWPSNAFEHEYFEFLQLHFRALNLVPVMGIIGMYSPPQNIIGTSNPYWTYCQGSGVPLVGVGAPRPAPPRPPLPGTGGIASGL